MKSLLAVFALFLCLSRTDDLDPLWDPDPSIPADLLPLRLTDRSYDQYVVDYATGSTFDPEKPWFIFFYYRKCKISQKFKPQYEEIARELTEYAHFAMVDVMEAEMLKETYAIKATPFFVMLKGDTAIEYENSRSKEAILQFIRVDHA